MQRRSRPVVARVIAGVTLAAVAGGSPALAQQAVPPARLAAAPAGAVFSLVPDVPADTRPAPPAAPPAPAPPPPGVDRPYFQAPPLPVVGRRPAALREEQPVGPTGQPAWTGQRRFVDSRVYVIPENEVEVEFWAIPRIYKNGTTDSRWLQEIEVGLPHRLQLDLYFRQDTENNQTKVGGQFEVRYALADWNVIPGNPTIYLEYAPLDGRPDRVEGRLLLGGELATRWHWAVNLAGEFEVSGGHEQEYALNTALSYTVLDDKFSVGAETEFEFTSSHGHRHHLQDSMLLGPSIQWKPVPRMHIDLAPLIGLTHESPDARVYFIIGYKL